MYLIWYFLVKRYFASCKWKCMELMHERLICSIQAASNFPSCCPNLWPCLTSVIAYRARLYHDNVKKTQKNKHWWLIKAPFWDNIVTYGLIFEWHNNFLQIWIEHWILSYCSWDAVSYYPWYECVLSILTEKKHVNRHNICIVWSYVIRYIIHSI